MPVNRILRLAHTDFRLPDGRLFRYDPRGRTLAIDHCLDKASWLSRDRMRVIASLDDSRKWGVLLHVSASYQDRDPTWADLKALKAHFFGDDVDAGLIMPKAEDYVAGVPGWEDSHVFHIWELPEAWGMQ